MPAGHVWLQGDNTLNSTDSRHYGPVPYALVNGKAFLKVCDKVVLTSNGFVTVPVLQPRQDCVLTVAGVAFERGWLGV